MALMAGAPAWLPFVAPLVAGVSLVIWARVPERRRDLPLRAVLLVSVSLAALEMLVVALIVAFLAIVSGSGGIEDF
jgi:hypothetical protein